MAGSERQPLRLVLDTNIVVAGLLWNGSLRRLITLRRRRKPSSPIQLLISVPTPLSRARRW